METGLEAIREYFAHLRTTTNADIRRSMLWAFYFDNVPIKHVERLTLELTERGFAVEVLPVAAELETSRIKAEKREQHNEHSAAALWREFELLAERFPPSFLTGVSFK